MPTQSDGARASERGQAQSADRRLDQRELVPDNCSVRLDHRMHGQRASFEPWFVPRKAWLIWDGCRWAHDDTGEVMRLAKRTARAIYREGTARAFFPGTPIRDIADPQSTNGTAALSQGAVFSGSLEPASAAQLSEVFVGHEGLEPSTNGLRIHCSTN
jgi:hypothetical protein